MRMIAMAAAVLVTMPLAAQEMPKPGPEHALLKTREGTWETTMKAGGQDSKGTVTYKMGLGGFWLTGDMDSEMFGAKFLGHSLESYNPVKKKYVSIWVDSMSPAPVTMEGTYDKEKKTYTMEGEGPGMDGKSAKFKSVTKVPDADTIEMTMYIGDTKDAAFTVIYKRKK